MVAQAGGTAMAQGSLTRETANDRFKKTFNSWFWGGICVATVMPDDEKVANIPVTTDVFVKIDVLQLEIEGSKKEQFVPNGLTKTPKWVIRNGELVPK